MNGGGRIFLFQGLPPLPLMRVVMGFRLMQRMVMLMGSVLAGVVMVMGLRTRSMRVFMAVLVKVFMGVLVRVFVRMFRFPMGVFMGMDVSVLMSV